MRLQENNHEYPCRGVYSIKKGVPLILQYSHSRKDVGGLTLPVMKTREQN